MALKDLIVRGPMPPEAKGIDSPRLRRDGKRDRRRIQSAESARRYRKRNHKLEPQVIDAESWFYEDRKGLLIVHEIRTDDGSYIRTDQFTIPWRFVVASVKRHELKPVT
jgi:competence CoiA-like predicted nuclease